MSKKNVKHLGQVFTETDIVNQMIKLMKNKGNILEPSAGDGAFAKHLPKKRLVAVQIDKKFARKNKFLAMDFFDFKTDKKFSTIIGNPPYVRHQDIIKRTKRKLERYNDMFDNRSNLYLYFIYKSILHLKNKGELIFITPRDFIKSTSARKLNEFIYKEGTITDFIDIGDKKIFGQATPNTAIWRFQKGNFTRKTNRNLNFRCIDGQLLFTKHKYTVKLSDIAFVKVGALSGANDIFEHKDGIRFVYSETRKTGKTKNMIYFKKHPYLNKFKKKLLKRGVKDFNQSNWWEWGRRYYHSNKPRVYVNVRTRTKNPFFLSSVKAYDGSILAIFPKFKCNKKILEQFKKDLNSVDWNDLGFMVGNRYIFNQKALENVCLPSKFNKYKKLLKR